MNTEEMKGKISEILDAESGYGFQSFVCVKSSDGLKSLVFSLEDTDKSSFKDVVCSTISDCINKHYLTDEAELKSCDDIHDNTNSFYEVPQNAEYQPFAFLDSKCTVRFTDKDKPNLVGFLFYFNLGDSGFWAYQHVYPVRMPTKSNGFYAFFDKSVYKELKKELLRIDFRVDLLVIDGSIITQNINLLQKAFAFDQYIRNESQKAIQMIDCLGIIEDMSAILNFEGVEKLTNAKKLMKIRNSPVLQMDKAKLIKGLQTIKRYKGRLKIKNGKIQISSKKDVIELLKILNDDYLKSELTGQEYESSSKIIEKRT